MFSKFKYTPSSTYEGTFSSYIKKGQEIFEETNTKIRKQLKEFIFNNGNIDGTSLKENWFPVIDANIFLSHSHKDLEKVKGFAGWLFDKFGLKTFIDSSVWGYCDELLKEIDNMYCYQPENSTYSYEKRNHTTAHVHIMLASALTEMMDNCECVIFYNTPNSIFISEELSKVDDAKKETTLSPWIYYELSILSTLRTKNIDREFLMHGNYLLYEKKNKLKVEYDVGKLLNSMITINDDIIKQWSKTNKKYDEALDELYKLASHM